jgi:hypothetical protein
MAQGSKKKYTSKQKRKAHDIEKGYKKRGVSSKRSGTPRMGDSKQIRSGRPEKRRRRSRQKAKQIKFSQRWE